MRKINYSEKLKLDMQTKHFIGLILYFIMQNKNGFKAYCSF